MVGLVNAHISSAFLLFSLALTSSLVHPLWIDSRTTVDGTFSLPVFLSLSLSPHHFVSFYSCLFSVNIHILSIKKRAKMNDYRWGKRTILTNRMARETEPCINMYSTQILSFNLSFRALWVVVSWYYGNGWWLWLAESLHSNHFVSQDIYSIRYESLESENPSRIDLFAARRFYDSICFISSHSERKWNKEWWWNTNKCKYIEGKAGKQIESSLIGSEDARHTHTHSLPHTQIK